MCLFYRIDNYYLFNIYIYYVLFFIYSRWVIMRESTHIVVCHRNETRDLWLLVQEIGNYCSLLSLFHFSNYYTVPVQPSIYYVFLSYIYIFLILFLYIFRFIFIWKYHVLQTVVVRRHHWGPIEGPF